MRFDLIIGNPPFQHPKVRGSRGVFWVKFIVLADRYINQNGLIAYITPASWMRLSSRNTSNFFLSNQLLWVRTNLKSYFPKTGSSFTAWILQNKIKATNTYFVDLDEYIDLTQCSGIPLMCPEGWSIIDRITKSIPKFNIVECNRNDYRKPIRYQPNKTELHQYEVRHTNPKTMWADKEPLDYYQSKVIMTYSGYANPTFYIKPIGSTRPMSCHFVTDKGDQFIRLLKSKLFLFYRLSQKPGGFNHISSFTIPLLDLDRSWTDNELYQYFNLTEKEIKIVETFYDSKVATAEK